MTMISPAAGRVSSEYGRRGSVPGIKTDPFHAGIDIAAALGTPIHAAFAGKVIRAGWNIVAYRSGIGVLITNPDGESQYYGHLSAERVSIGQQVTAGQRIGDMGATGNVTGPHLHFEVWASASQASHRNPRVDFAFFDLAPGSAPKVGTTPAPKPAPKPPTKAPSVPAGVKTALARMGLDPTIAGIKSYQKSHRLFEDGDWGPKTQAHWESIVALQKALNMMRSDSRDLVVDGYLGDRTEAKIANIRSRNGFGARTHTSPGFRAFLTRITGIKL